VQTEPDAPGDELVQYVVVSPSGKWYVRASKLVVDPYSQQLTFFHRGSAVAVFRRWDSVVKTPEPEETVQS
jgi:hypothetical protein